MLLGRPQELSLVTSTRCHLPTSATTSFSVFSAPSVTPKPKPVSSFFMRTSRVSPSHFTFLRLLSLPFSHTHNLRHNYRCLFRSYIVPPALIWFRKPHKFYPLSKLCTCTNAFFEQLVGVKDASEDEEKLAFPCDPEVGVFDFDKSAGAFDMKHLSVTDVKVRDLEELPEQWRRARLAWLCKQLPAYKSGTLVRILNAQKKWMRQEDATYVAVHCMRIRENETSFRVYKWMMQQHWYRFDFALATKLADYLGKERKFTKCREIFDDIINQGRVPCESTFHILIVAYISSSIQGCLEEACGIYNRMIQLGGYQPRLSLHNSLFRALVSMPGLSSKNYLKQAEFIFHNLVTTGLEIHKDIYGGLIWLHSYQDSVDKERIISLREEMQKVGIKESKEVLLSILRACSKEGDVEEAERMWLKLLHSDGAFPPLAFVYKMEVYSKVGEPMKSLAIFRKMQEKPGATTFAAYNKIIEILCQSQEVQHAESLMKELIDSGLKPLTPSYVHLLNMYFNLNLHEKLEMTVCDCLENCQPNRTIYSIYLDSLVKIGNFEKAEEVFNVMFNDGSIGINGRSCNIMLRGFLSSGENVKAEKVYNLMCEKKYDVETPSIEKLEYILSLRRKNVKRPISMKLSKEQREILVGMLLGGLHIESDDQRKDHVVRFDFNENSDAHSVLRRHIHDQFHEWLHPSFRLSNGSEDIPQRFCTTPQSQFGFYADQFWPKGRPAIPNLIHRWLSPCVLAYWYMYRGHRSSAGDVLLKLKGTRDGVEKIVKSLKAKSIECRVKRKGNVFWIGIIGNNALWFWKLVEPHILEEVKASLQPANPTLENSSVATQDINFDSGSDSDYTDADNL